VRAQLHLQSGLRKRGRWREGKVEGRVPGRCRGWQGLRRRCSVLQLHHPACNLSHLLTPDPTHSPALLPTCRFEREEGEERLPCSCGAPTCSGFLN